MAELKPCPFCGDTKIKLLTRKEIGVPSGDNGWYAELKCQCGANIKVWALKHSWAEETIKRKWNRRAGEEDKHETD